MKKRKLILYGLAALALASVGLTWASWTSALQAGTEYQIPRYRTSLEEEFEHPDDWQPGVTTQKLVWVSNNTKAAGGSTESGVKAIAKVELHQSWVRRENVYATNSDGVREAVAPLAGESLPLIFADEDGTGSYAAVLEWNTDAVVVLSSGKAQDAGIRLGLPYVEDPADAEGKWLLTDEEPDEDGNFVLYYMGILNPGEDSPAFLTGVTMNPLLEATVTAKDTTFEKTEDGYRQVTVTSTNAKYGYDACHYSMDIKMTTVQATKAAVEQTFNGGFDGAVVRYLADEVAESGVYDAYDLEKKLTIVRDGSRKKLEYIPYRTADGSEDGNWFMSFTDMVPGGIYKDRLTVENTVSGSGLRVYLRLSPREQESMAQELLEKITMKVWAGGELLYEGKVTGAQYGEGANLQELIPLCYVNAKSSVAVDVELQLDPSITCDPVTGACVYAEQLAKVDWEFVIQGSSGGGGGGGGGGGTTPGGGTPPGGPGVTPETELHEIMVPEADVPLTALLPKTGDTGHFAFFLAVFAASSILFVTVLATGKKEKTNRPER